MQLIQSSRKRKGGIYVLLLLLIIVLSNVAPLHPFFLFFLDNDHYRYSNANGAFTFTEESKGRNFAMAKRSFDGYKMQTPDTILYRLFRKNPLTFWRWSDYINDPKYNLPYKSWGEIRKVRGYDLKYSNNWQDF